MLTIALVYGHKHGSLVAWVGSSCRFITQRALVSPLESPVSLVTNFLSILDMNSLMWHEHQIQSEVNCSSLWQTYHGFSGELLLPAQTALLHSILCWAKLEMTMSPSSCHPRKAWGLVSREEASHSISAWLLCVLWPRHLVKQLDLTN